MDRVRAALHQLQPALGEPGRNLRTLAKRAAQGNADLVLFPELYLTGYFNRDALRTLAEPLDGPMGQELRRVAKRTGRHIVAGMPRQGLRGVVHNSSVLATPEGELHAYDKVYLPTFSVFEEDIYFGEGHALPTFDTSLGKIGMCICYDLFFPEITKAMAMQGAEILTCISASPTISRTYFEQVLPARAIETTSFLLFTNLVGPQDQVTFWGGARAFGPRGDVIAQGPTMKEAVTHATLDLEDVPVARLRRPVLRDTRPELFGAMARDPMPEAMRVLERVHGGLSPWAVAGLRAGMRARQLLRAEGELRAEATCPREAMAFADGLLVGARCSPGRGTLLVREGPEVEVACSAGRRSVVLRLTPGARKLCESDGSGAVWAVHALPLDELCEVA